ncbi:MAG: hypothetical protein KC496_18025 [Anaerolineae bacterium]|nr:hypothetical protein [Anaerolineae bacterium]
MALETSWFIPEKVILLRATGDLTTEDIVQSTEAGVVLIESCTTPRIHVLFDTEELISFTRDVFALSSAVQKLMGHPRYGWFVMFGRNDPIVRFITSIVTQIFKRNFKICVTREEAVDFLQELIDEESNGSGRS